MGRLVDYYSIDVVILVEASCEPSEILKVLNYRRESKYMIAPTLAKGFQIYVNFPPEFIGAIAESDRYTIRALKLPITLEYLLVGTHMPSKLYRDPAEQTFFASSLSAEIRGIERDRGHNRTILVGDFNMNPFEEGMIQANAFNAVSSYAVAKKSKGSRGYYGESYAFFYNPMWNFLGDRTLFKPGTYYYDSGALSNYYWNMFDQVLIRPSIAGSFSYNKLKIIEFDGGQKLTTASGKPDASISDHLPVAFEVKLEIVGK